jgi:serine/threonine protein kinase
VADLDLSNFVLARPDFSTFAETEVVRKLFSDPKGNVTKVKTKDGSPLPEGVHAFVSSPVTFDEKKVDLDNLLVKLVDFGGGKLTFSVVHSGISANASQYPAFTTATKLKVHTHSRNTPPELINGATASSSSDIWA